MPPNRSLPIKLFLAYDFLGQMHGLFYTNFSTNAKTNCIMVRIRNSTTTSNLSCTCSIPLRQCTFNCYHMTWNTLGCTSSGCSKQITDHNFMQNRTSAFIHLVEFINTTDTVVTQYQCTSTETTSLLSTQVYLDTNYVSATQQSYLNTWLALLSIFYLQFPQTRIVKACGQYQTEIH